MVWIYWQKEVSGGCIGVYWLCIVMVEELENPEVKGWRKGYHHLDDYEKRDEKEVYTWLLQIRVIYKTSDIATRVF